MIKLVFQWWEKHSWNRKQYSVVQVILRYELAPGRSLLPLAAAELMQ